MKMRKIVLKALVLLFVFCLGYFLCAIDDVVFHRDRMDGIHFYVYDMKSLASKRFSQFFL